MGLCLDSSCWANPRIYSRCGGLSTIRDFILSSSDKREIWCTLSDLFLDTAISVSLARISAVCAKSDFSIDEITDMLYSEVAPVCMPNLLTVVGEWTGFDEEQLVKKIINYLNTQQSAMKKLFKPKWGLIARLYIGKDWLKVVKLIEEKRSSSTDSLAKT